MQLRQQRRLSRAARWAAALITTALCALLINHIARQLGATGVGNFTGIYTIVIAVYVFSRFVLAAMYRAPRDAGLEPSIAIIVPAFNEGIAVERTIDACCAIDYPTDKLEVIVVNDGSTDETWQHMNHAANRHRGRVTCIDLGRNKGKRAAVTAGIRASTADFLVSVDSDSLPAPEGVRKLIQGFADPKVGAISGITHVRNANANLLTRMQAASYYVNFQLFKAAESVVNTVSCASGCFCAYRRTAVMPVLDAWECQTLFGRRWEHGDDRALTNMILRRWKIIYDGQAEAWTTAPDEYCKFFKQQLRWQKSFVGESLVLVGHTWRSHPIAFPAVLIATVSGIVSPLVLTYQFIWQPIESATAPVFFLLCLYLLNASYALFYRSRRNDGIWKYALLSAFFYIAFSPQIFWAIIRIRDNSWGTRVATPPAAPVIPITEEEPMATVVQLPVRQQRSWPRRALEKGRA